MLWVDAFVYLINSTAKQDNRSALASNIKVFMYLKQEALAHESEHSTLW